MIEHELFSQQRIHAVTVALSILGIVSLTAALLLIYAENPPQYLGFWLCLGGTILLFTAIAIAGVNHVLRRG